MECNIDHNTLKNKYCPQRGTEVTSGSNTWPTSPQEDCPTALANPNNAYNIFNNRQYASQTTNGFAIAGFVTSLIACAPVGLILSAVALSQFKSDPNQKGKGLAIAGLVISLISLVFFLILFVILVVASKSYSG